MTHKSLLMAFAALSLVAVSASAEAADCRRGDRTDSLFSKTFHRTDRMFQRTGDTLLRGTDRIFKRTGDTLARGSDTFVRGGDRLFQRTGDTLTRSGDRMHTWFQRRTRA